MKEEGYCMGLHGARASLEKGGGAAGDGAMERERDGAKMRGVRYGRGAGTLTASAGVKSGAGRRVAWGVGKHTPWLDLCRSVNVRLAKWRGAGRGW